MACEVRCGVTDCLQTDTHDNTVTVTAHACRRLIIGWQYWEFHKPTQTLLKLDFTKIVPFQKNGPNHTITIEFGALRRIKYKVGSRDTSLIRSPLEKTGRLVKDQPLPREESKSENILSENMRNNLPNRSRRYTHGTRLPSLPRNI